MSQEDISRSQEQQGSQEAKTKLTGINISFMPGKEVQQAMAEIKIRGIWLKWIREFLGPVKWNGYSGS